jgi:5-methylcytosine-specific restriction endonuclease McrA
VSAKDSIGKRFNQWVVLALDARRTPSGGSYVLCRCDCGTEKAVNWGHLSHSRSKDCGCARRGKTRKMGLANRKHDGVSATNTRMLAYRRRAIKCGLDFLLTRDQFISLTTGNCHYCGRPPYQVETPFNPDTGSFVYTGIDRVDSSIGYILENCVSCCRFCNVAKSDMSVGDFKQLIVRIYHHFVAGTMS